MSSLTALVARVTPRVSIFEAAFIRTVLESQGGDVDDPSLTEFLAATDVLRRFDVQCADNGNKRDDYDIPNVDTETHAALRAKAFLLFGVTRPTAAQLHKAHAELYGSLMCATCG